jgi:hypothetical protein
MGGGGDGGGGSDMMISLGLDVQKHERELRGRELQAPKKIIRYL